MEKKTLPVRDGAKIYYERWGSGKGETLLMLHGNGEQSSIFTALAGFFEASDIIVMDSRAHGASERGSLPLNFETMADDLKAVLEAEGIERASLIGFSDGASIALSFALRYPESVKSLALLGANTSPGGVKKSVQIPIVIAYGLSCIAALFSSDAKRRSEILALMVKHPHFKPEDLRKIKQPVLLLYGEHDMMTSKQIDLIATSIANSKLQIIKDADHFAVIKMPGEVAQRLHAFYGS